MYPFGKIILKCLTSGKHSLLQNGNKYPSFFLKKTKERWKEGISYHFKDPTPPQKKIICKLLLINKVNLTLHYFISYIYVHIFIYVLTFADLWISDRFPILVNLEALTLVYFTYKNKSYKPITSVKTNHINL